METVGFFGVVTGIIARLWPVWLSLVIFFGGVVFTCGLVAHGDLVRVYYGAADGVTAVADLSLAEILGGLA